MALCDRPLAKIKQCDNSSGKGSMKDRQGQEKEMGEGKNNQQTVNRLGGADHKRFKTQVHFILFEHDLNFSAVGVMGQNLLIRKT